MTQSPSQALPGSSLQRQGDLLPGAFKVKTVEDQSPEWHFPLLFLFFSGLREACYKKDMVFCDEKQDTLRVIRAWLKCNPLSLLRPRTKQMGLICDKDTSSYLLCGPAQQPSDRSALLSLSHSCLLRQPWGTRIALQHAFQRLEKAVKNLNCLPFTF